jgi:superfamily I DNA/RNA helicase
MPLVLADTLFPAVGRLDPADIQRVWTFLEKLRQNPAQPGINLERIAQGRDAKLWSGRVTQDLRAILYKDGDTLIVLYAGQHDGAYAWAARHRVERHDITGAVQIVETPERIEQQLDEAPPPTGSVEPLFADCSDDYLQRLGVPTDWLPAVRRVATDDMLLEVASGLPPEVGERLLRVATGERVEPPVPLPPERAGFDSPEARQRFYLVEDDEDLQRVLAAPLATWVTFLHPSQRTLVTRSFKGPVKVTGSAGTGKTVVAMHRARHLARQGKRVLLTSYVRTLCWLIERNLALLCSPAEQARITVDTVHAQALNLVKRVWPKAFPVQPDRVAKEIEKQARRLDCPGEPAFLRAEWEQVIEARGITTWPGYRAANRTGRGRALTISDRQSIWPVFEAVLEWLDHEGGFTYAGLCREARALLTSGQVPRPFDAVIVDEVQDLGPQELAFVAALAGDGPDRLMLVGDAGQRIYARRFSLRALGIDVRGQSHVLRINYRTTEQIRRFADRVLGDVVDDLDEGRENRRATRSLLRGPEPALHGFKTAAEQHQFIIERISACRREGVGYEEIAVFAHTNELLDAIQAALTAAGLPVNRLRRDERAGPAGVNLGTMHRAKGLEFKVVFVADCADDILPLPRALQEATDGAEREDALARERQLFYVSLTRARDELFVTWTGQPSPFLDGLVAAQRKER